MRDRERFSEQLQRTARLTGARWAAWTVPTGGGWQAMLAWGLSRARSKTLKTCLQKPQWHTWLGGALANGRERSRKTAPEDAAALGQRLYAFPMPARGGVLLVGADALARAERQMWRIVALGAPIPESSRALLSGDVPVSNDRVPAICLRLMERLGKSDYRPQKVAEAVVVSVPEILSCERVYLAVLDGKTWRVLAAWGKDAAALQDQVIPWQDIPALHPLADGERVVLSREPLPGIPTPQPWHWVGIPLARGRQVIGVLAAGRHQTPFHADESERLGRLLSRVSWVLESVLSLEEVGVHLRRKAVINDVFLSVFASDNVIEAARNATHYLRRVLEADVAAVLLPEENGMLKVLGGSPETFRKRRFPSDESLCGYVLETGKVARVGDVRQAPRYFPLIEGIRSELCVPMRSRQGIVGVLNLESTRPDAFDEEDEHLLMGVANQLALLLETMQLRQDVAARALRMELVHRVVRDVVGLLDEQQVVTQAAQRIADYFGFEITMVVVFDRTPKGYRPLFREVAGSSGQDLTWKIEAGSSENEGIVGYVLRTGKSALVNDTEADKRFVPFPGFEALSELCVPLFSHENDNSVIGVIDIARGVKHAFTEDDRLALEAIGGVLSEVLSNARRYRRLNTMVSHLDAARATALDIISDLEMETLLRRIVHRVRSLLDAQGAEIGLLDTESEEVRIVVSDNPWKDYTGYAFPLGKGVSGWVAANGKTMIIDDYATWEGRSPSKWAAAFRAVVSVPLTFGDEVMGVLTVYDDRVGRRFNDDDVALLELLAPQVAIAIRNARLYQELGERIKAQRKAEQDLIQSARLAAVGEMAAAVAHELNSPLTTVMGFVELALEDLPQSNKTHEDLQLVLQEARRARDIVRRLLDFARRTEPMRIATNINILINETLALVAHLLTTSGVMLEVHLNENLPLVQVDRAEMKQVLLNLIHNALQAMPHGGQLQISTSRAENETGAWVVIAIKDTGIGMSAEQQMRIFEPFYTTQRGGTGMGLAVSYSIVQQHGGDILVQSREGVGSTFTVRLPIS